MLLLDSGGLSRLASRTQTAAALIRAFRAQELCPPIVPTMVLVESLHGDPRRDANTHPMSDPLDARVARTRTAVLNAGAKLLFTHGWDAVTHLRVAAEANVGRATVYRPWPTVEDLLTDVLVDCQAPLPTPAPSGDLRQDLISAIAVFVDPLQTSKLGEVLIAAIDRAPSDPRIQAMQDAMVDISRTPVWEVANAAIDRGALASSLTKTIVAAQTIGPIAYARLFERKTITTNDIERTVDIFLSAFET